jgi:F-type H+-transporting ATPase subunit delta
MSSTVAKKYVNALMSSCTENELSVVYALLTELLKAFKIDKFNNIILSPDVTLANKENLVLSLVETKNAKFENFIKLLNCNDRLGLIPSIAKELKYQVSLKKNAFEGEIFSNFEITKAQIATLEANFSKKFNAQVTLHSTVNDYPGIKVQLDDLGVEVSFSLERLKAQLTEHILKAI